MRVVDCVGWFLRIISSRTSSIGLIIGVMLGHGNVRNTLVNYHTMYCVIGSYGYGTLVLYRAQLMLLCRKCLSSGRKYFLDNYRSTIPHCVLLILYLSWIAVLLYILALTQSLICISKKWHSSEQENCLQLRICKLNVFLDNVGLYINPWLHLCGHQKVRPHKEIWCNKGISDSSSLRQSIIGSALWITDHMC